MNEIEDFGLIVLCAFRYALGRMTYIPSVVAGFIKANINEIETRDIHIMIREIGECHEEGHLGMDCDVKLWLDLRKWLEGELDKRDE